MHVQVNLFASLRLIFGFSISLFMILLSLVSNLVLNMTNVFVVTPWFYKLLLKNKNCILQVSHSTHKQNLRFSEPWHSPLKEATFRVVNPCECQYKVWPKHTQPPPELLARDVNLWYNRRANSPVIVAIIKFT